MQMQSVEQRFKNYIDERYHLYDNADTLFYNQLVHGKENTAGFAEKMKVHQDRRQGIMEARIKAQLEGKPLPK